MSIFTDESGGPFLNSVIRSARVKKEEVQAMMDQFLILGRSADEVELAGLWVLNGVASYLPFRDQSVLSTAYSRHGFWTVGRESYLRLDWYIWFSDYRLKETFLARAKRADRRANRKTIDSLVWDHMRPLDPEEWDRRYGGGS